MGRSADDRSRRTVLPDAARMASVEIPADGNAIVLRGVDVRLLGKLLNQQKQEGRAAVQMIAAAAVQAPPKGAAEPGKGSLVDVVV
jgi:hypothetical protein